MQEEKIEALYHYFTYLTETHGLQISMHDFSRVLVGNTLFSKRLHPFLIHHNPFCMHIKANKVLFEKCHLRRKWIAEKCRKEKQIYYGMCYMGVEEYVVPVFHQEQLIACLFVGCFCEHEETARRLIRRNAKLNALDIDTLTDAYDTSFSKQVVPHELVKKLTLILSQYLAYFYEQEIAKNKEAAVLQSFSKEDYILPHILGYIYENYKSEVNVKDLARYCHCSDSTIHHLFKKRMQTNISAFVNGLRIADAKRMLTDTNLPMKEIAFRIGFNDPNYFSKVFRDSCGVFPTQFRKNYMSNLNPLGK